MADSAPSPALDPSARGWTLATARPALLPLLSILPLTLAACLAITPARVAAVASRGTVPGRLPLLLTLAMVGAVFTIMGTRLGRDTGCALLAAILAIKPAEAHTLRDARSLLGFSLFAPFAAFLMAQGLLA